MKSWMSDIVVTLSALVVAAGFGYLYYHDFNTQLGAGNRKPVGTITFERNLTQRRFGDQVVWQQVGTSSALYNQDSIRTSSDSYAVITLNDGTRISLNPDSLITLDWGRKSKTVDFLSGSITAARSGPAALTTNTAGSSAPTKGTAAGLVIKSGRSQVEVGSASVNLSATSGGGLQMSVASGQATLSVGRTVKTVGAQQSAQVNTKTGSTTVNNIAITPENPSDSSVFVTLGKEVPVGFGWHSRAHNSHFTLQVSPSAKFGSSTQSLTTASESAKMKLAPGEYYWRVSSGGNASPVQHLSVFQDVRTTPQAPNAGESFSYTKRAPVVGFAWSPSKVTGSYEVQVSTDRSFSNFAEQVAVSANSVAVDTLTAGTYYWRVLPIYGGGAPDASAASPISSFQIVRVRALRPATLITPVEKASLNLISVRSSGLLFNWASDNAIGQWKITIARNPSLTSVVASVMTINNYYVLQNSLNSGTYYWRVQGQGLNGTNAPPSVVRTFKLHPLRATIKLLSPRSDWAYDGTSIGNVPVIWRSDIHGNFIVELSNSADFSTLYRKINTTFNNASFGPLPPGTYFWRVNLVATDGTVELSSGNHSFTVLPPLAAPIAVSPSPSKKLKLINPKKLTFRWDGDPRSHFYNFRLYAPTNGGGPTAIASANNLTANEYVLKDLGILGTGTYTWQIWADNPAAAGLSPQMSPLTRATFTIGALRFVPAPKLLHPSANGVINGLSALNNGVAFRWVPSDPAGSSILQIASDPVFVKGLHQIRTRSGSASLPEMLPGTYYWRVNSKTHDGIVAPKSKINEFTVTTLPSLAQPSSVSPSEGSTVAMSGKTALDFSWKPVPAASGYDITLTNVQTGVRVFKRTDLSSTSFAYSDLKNLDVGEFQWTIEAYESDRSGKTVRTSEPLSSKFAIALGKIAAANINTAKQFFVH